MLSEQTVTSKTISGKFLKRYSESLPYSFFFLVLLMCRQFSSIFLVLLLIVTLLPSAPVSAQNKLNEDPHFSDLIITTSKTHLLLFGLVNNGINEEMRKGLHNGIPIQFSFVIELNKTEENWPDLQLMSMQFQHILSYDTLQENYRLECSEKNQKIEVFDRLEDALKVMNEINGILVIELSQLIPDSSYQLKIKGSLYENKLPMNLDSILPFASWWDVETDWHIIEFTY